MSQDTWKLENDLCRCCHSEGSYLCLSDTHEEDGEEFSYSNLLRETLDIDLTPMEGPLSMKTFTICYICILQLRNAAQFKRQVLMREERFKVMFSKIEVSIEDIKKEIIISDDDAMSDAGDFNNDDFQLDNPVKVEVPLLVPKEEKRRERQVRKVKPKVTTVVKKPKRTARAKKNKVETEMEGGAMADEDAASKERASNADQYDYTLVRDNRRFKYKCNKCEMIFATIQSFLYHMTHHHSNKKQKCPLCALKFKYEGSKIRHLQYVHNMEEINIGGQIILRKRTVKREEIKAPKCELCEVDKSDHSHYKHHMHMPNNPSVKIPLYKCTYCPEMFPCGKVRNMHMKKHSKEKTKVCSICDERFVLQMSLDHHVATRHAE